MSPFLLQMIAKNKIEAIVNEWVGSSDRFLVEVKTSPSKVTVFIDKPTGIALDECSALNKYITAQLDPEGVWETHELEVSSPGMDQPLKVYQQYLRRIGREIKVVTTQGIEHKGLLKSANETKFELQEITSRKENKKKILTEVNHHFSYSQIKETKLVLSFKN
jgi:ribosome maturation factor RimP